MLCQMDRLVEQVVEQDGDLEGGDTMEGGEAIKGQRHDRMGAKSEPKIDR